MYELTKEELQKVKGGELGTGTIFLISGAIVFIIGVIDGYLRPERCH